MKRERESGREKWVHMDCTLGCREVKGGNLVMVGGQHMGPPPPPFVLNCPGPRPQAPGPLPFLPLSLSLCFMQTETLVRFQNIHHDRFQRPWEMYP